MSQLSLMELKAMAYDVIAQIEYLQKELVRINQNIANFKEDKQSKKEEKNA
jgi:hypothetical protein